MQPVFLELAEVLELHRSLLERYGGRPGLVDLDLLLSALDAPRAGLGQKYLHRGPWEMAAAYLYYVITLHPFVDGNRRVAAAAALVFLELNGCTLEAEDSELERLVRDLSAGGSGKTQAAEFFRRRVVRKEV